MAIVTVDKSGLENLLNEELSSNPNLVRHHLLGRVANMKVVMMLVPVEEDCTLQQQNTLQLVKSVPGYIVEAEYIEQQLANMYLEPSKVVLGDYRDLLNKD